MLSFYFFFFSQIVFFFLFISSHHFVTDNVLLQLDTNGSPMFSILADFGIAVQLPNSSFRVPFQIAFERGGAPFYLAPEIATAEPGLNSELDYSKSDVFGLGLVLYHMLSGETPNAFGSANHSEFSDARYLDLPECYDERVRAVVRNMLTPDYTRRLSALQARDAIYAIEP